MSVAFILQKDTDFLFCGCGGSKFYLGFANIQNDRIPLCCAECKKNTAEIIINNKGQLEFTTSGINVFNKETLKKYAYNNL